MSIKRISLNVLGALLIGNSAQAAILGLLYSAPGNEVNVTFKRIGETTFVSISVPADANTGDHVWLTDQVPGSMDVGALLNMLQRQQEGQPNFKRQGVQFQRGVASIYLFRDEERATGDPFGVLWTVAVPLAAQQKAADGTLLKREYRVPLVDLLGPQSRQAFVNGKFSLSFITHGPARPGEFEPPLNEELFSVTRILETIDPNNKSGLNGCASLLSLF